MRHLVASDMIFGKKFWMLTIMKHNKEKSGQSFDYDLWSNGMSNLTYLL